MKPIYEPKGKAKEYGDYALNIYTGCPHRCFYCFAPNVLHKDKEAFHSNVEPRKNIVEETRKQIEKEHITGKLIHLCFSCDPYPKGYDSSVTREIIKLLKETGNHVQILTKNGKDALRDFDLLDENDWFGITYAGYNKVSTTEEEPNAGMLVHRLYALFHAHKLGINTWVSAEPVINAQDLFDTIKRCDFVDVWKAGKMNYHKSDINWKEFGIEVEALLQECVKSGTVKNYYIKDSLITEMNKE